MSAARRSGGRFHRRSLLEFRDGIVLGPGNGILHRHRQRPSVDRKSGKLPESYIPASRPLRATSKVQNLRSRRMPRALRRLPLDKVFAAYPALVRDIFKYLTRLAVRGPKPNREAQLSSRFAKIHAPAQAAITKAGVLAKEARISCIFPSRGIQDNSVNRLLLMSSSEKHLPSVPMAFFIEQRMATGNA